jgi:hypothetical protein
MSTQYPEPHASRHFQGLIFPASPTSGIEDDYDNRDDEHAGENEASVRADNEGTEIPEEFDVEYKARLDDPKDDDAPEEVNGDSG